MKTPTLADGDSDASDAAYSRLTRILTDVIDTRGARRSRD